MIFPPLFMQKESELIVTIPFLKLTYPLKKWMVEIRPRFLFGAFRPILQGRFAVSFGGG